MKGYSESNIKTKIEVKRTIQFYIKKKTYVRGFRPKQDPRILNFYVQDETRSGRSKEISLEIK